MAPKHIWLWVLVYLVKKQQVDKLAQPVFGQPATKSCMSESAWSAVNLFTKQSLCLWPRLIKVSTGKYRPETHLNTQSPELTCVKPIPAPTPGLILLQIASLKHLWALSKLSDLTSEHSLKPINALLWDLLNQLSSVHRATVFPVAQSAPASITPHTGHFNEAKGLNRHSLSETGAVSDRGTVCPVHSTDNTARQRMQQIWYRGYRNIWSYVWDKHV